MKTKVFSIIAALSSLVYYSPVFSQDLKQEPKFPVYNQDSKQEPKFKKQKSYTKTYNVSSGDLISLENQFGEMKLITWDRNEVKVDVSITGMSDEEARAQKILDRISVNDEKTSNGVSFKTKLAMNIDDKAWSEKNTYIHESMKINYTVYLPAANPLFAKNQFGAMIVPDYKGEATIEIQYGTLTAGKISNAKKISVGFGKADIDQVNNGIVNIQYSTGTIKKLVGNIDAKFEFCNAIKINVDNDVKSLDIINSYSTVYLDLSKDLSASYNISTSYGLFKNKSNFKIESGSDEERPSYMTTKYSGTSGSGSIKLNVRSSFGTVVAGHNLQVDMIKKKKSAAI